jgi:phage terminase large subunit-like protein
MLNSRPQNNSLAKKLAASLEDGGWRAKARPEQLPPPGDWNGWVVCAGRGFGKTRCGSEWVQEHVRPAWQRGSAWSARPPATFAT